MKDEGGGRGGRRHVKIAGDQTQQKQQMHTEQEFIHMWANLKVDPDATFKVSSIFEQFQNDFNKQEKIHTNPEGKPLQGGSILEKKTSVSCSPSDVQCT